MATPTNSALGDPCWMDVLTPDREAANRFYGQVRDWYAGEHSAEFTDFVQQAPHYSPYGRLAVIDDACRAPLRWTQN